MKNWNPYVRRTLPNGGVKYEHQLVVDRVVGLLPPKAVIHHVNDNRRDNRPANLVVLANTTEHTALHYRRSVRRAGGNPWTQHLCAKCGEPKAPTEFYVQKDRPLGRRSICIACFSALYNRRDRSVRDSC